MSEQTSEYLSKSAYYAGRALAEHRRMVAATDPRAAVVHGELAARYEALASDPSLELPEVESPDDEPPMLRHATG